VFSVNPQTSGDLAPLDLAQEAIDLAKEAAALKKTRSLSLKIL